jgi:uncharacterized protein YecE (DUF72 family)
MEWYFGTMGFSWKDWQGVFYPEGIETRDFLAYYSRFFNSVEIDSTFYGIPRESYVKRWAEITTGGFQMCAKIPKVITHEKVLVAVEDETRAFINTMRLLGEKLGVILVQFPPSFTVENRPALEGFLELLPADVRFAVEFRHQSWYTPETAELLRNHHVCWAATEYTDLPKRVEVTADFLYIRFIGEHGRYDRHDREQADVTAQLEWWWQRIQEQADRVHTVYGFFNNDYAGHAPASVNRFKKILGLPVENSTPPKQGRLF